MTTDRENHRKCFSTRTEDPSCICSDDGISVRESFVFLWVLPQAEDTMKRHLLTIMLGILTWVGAPLSAGGTTASVAGSVQSQGTDSLPFVALIGLIALGAILVLRKMIRDLF